MPTNPSKWLISDREPLEDWIWAGGRVVLLGDAAHAMLPHQGAGAGQAIEDSWILGRVLQDMFRATALMTEPPKLEQWMRLYQSVRLPRAQKHSGRPAELETCTKCRRKT